jgi:arylsulfatase A-like enzyme
MEARSPSQRSGATVRIHNRIPTPKHVEGKSIRALLADPNAASSAPALTTYGFRNHAVRDAGWRYIRYANGDEELYDEHEDPYEWVNLARDPKFAAKKAELGKFLPVSDRPEVSGPAAAANDAGN